MNLSLNEYFDEIIDEICSLDGCHEQDAKAIADARFSDIEYGHKYRLTPTVLAGSLLGINDCCITPVQNKS